MTSLLELEVNSPGLRVRYPVSAVGAVYDRAFDPLACESCAVIDRAYSKHSGLQSTLQEEPFLLRSLYLNT